MSQLPLRASPATLSPPVGYSHIAEARGRLIYISGQVPITPDGKLVGQGNVAAQTEQVFKNLEIAIREAGAKFSDVVKLNYYVAASVDRALVPQIRRVRGQYLDDSRLPASTFVFVAGLMREDWLIEIEAIVSLP